MSIMIAQSLENNRHAPAHTIGTPVPADNQVTQLLLQAMSLVGHDALTAIDFMRRASALAANEQPFAEPHDTIPTGTPGGLAPWQAKRSRRFIEDNLAGRITIDDLAKLTRLSPSYFCAAFRASFGTSPHDFVCRCRVDLAKRLMMETEAPLCEIALDSGFADQSHLSRVFRRVTGTTPAAWRRTRRTA